MLLQKFPTARHTTISRKLRRTKGQVRSLADHLSQRFALAITCHRHFSSQTLILHQANRQAARKNTQVRADANPIIFRYDRPCVRPCIRPCVRPCVRAYVRTSVRPSVRPYVRAYVRPCVRAYVRPCVRAYVRPCVRPCVRPSVRASVRTCVRPSVRAYARYRLPHLWVEIGTGC